MKTFKKFFLILSILGSTFVSTLASGNCPITKAPICHAGSVNNPNFVNICVDFEAVWGHLAHHALDTYGSCQGDQSIHPYVCNAGLRHILPLGQICIQHDLNRIASTCENSTNCVCSTTGPENNLHEADYMKFEIAPFLDGPTSSDFSEKRITASSGPGFNLAAPNQGGYIISHDDRFSFNLGSERIGADYFVDLCWKNNSSVPSNQHYRIDSSMSVTDSFFKSNGYLELANIKSRFEIYCDLNQTGITNYPNNPQYSSPLSSFLGETKNYTQLIPGARSCFIRHYFKENETNYLRPNDLKNVTVMSTLEVDQPAATASSVSICQVQQIQGSQFQCQTLNFNDQDSFKNYVLNYRNQANWRQDHQSDYQGKCISEGPCENIIR